jgi:hypothetical protein
LLKGTISEELIGEEEEGKQEEQITCLSVLAIAGIDSTLSIWKYGSKKPLCTIRNIFQMGFTDLTWGLFGTVLFASSQDGTIFTVHFKASELGQFISETEKQLIIRNTYGSTVLQEY